MYIIIYRYTKALFCIIYIFVLPRSIPGKLHQRIESFTHCHVATSKDKFLRLANCTDFVDFRCLGPDAAIAIRDGLSIPCRNLPAISARVYRCGLYNFIFLHRFLFFFFFRKKKF